jgi:hypothetical protein
MLTLNETKERLMRLDEVLLLEVLNITSEDIVDRFTDFIEAKLDDLVEELEDDYDPFQ